MRYVASIFSGATVGIGIALGVEWFYTRRYRRLFGFGKVVIHLPSDHGETP